MCGQEIHVGQCFCNTLFNLISCLTKLHFPKFGSNRGRFLQCCIFVFLRVDRLKHSCYLIHFSTRDYRKNVSVKVHNATLVFRIRYNKLRKKK